MADGKWIYVSGRDLVDMHGVPFLREEEAERLAGLCEIDLDASQPLVGPIRDPLADKLRNPLSPGDEDEVARVESLSFPERSK